MPELLLGCGASREKKIVRDGDTLWKALITLDINPDHNPDVVWDIEQLPLPFEDNEFDECHAYEVLEHTGRQGDWRGFFAQWSEFWRILKPDGLFIGTSPHWTSSWAWGDPGHSRIISQECLTFLAQSEYDAQIGKTAMTDYRFCYKADFEPVHMAASQDGSFCYVMRAVKPSRCGRP